MPKSAGGRGLGEAGRRGDSSLASFSEARGQRESITPARVGDEVARAQARRRRWILSKYLA